MCSFFGYRICDFGTSLTVDRKYFRVGVYCKWRRCHVCWFYHGLWFLCSAVFLFSCNVVIWVYYKEPQTKSNLVLFCLKLWLLGQQF